MSTFVDARFAGCLIVNTSELTHATRAGVVTVKVQGMKFVLFPHEAVELARALLKEAGNADKQRTLKRPATVDERLREAAG